MKILGVVKQMSISGAIIVDGFDIKREIAILRHVEGEYSLGVRRGNAVFEYNSWRWEHKPRRKLVEIFDAHANFSSRLESIYRRVRATRHDFEFDCVIDGEQLLVFVIVGALHLNAQLGESIDLVDFKGEIVLTGGSQVNATVYAVITVLNHNWLQQLLNTFF